MKRLAGVVLVLLMAVAPAWCAKKITVGQLEDMLRSLEQEKKTDAEVATALKQVELTEELTRATLNTLLRNVPGPLSAEQVYVLETSSADLTPPATDLPATPAPDGAAQQAILSKAGDYVSQVYAKLPALTATRTMLRFQDNFEAVSSSSGMQNGAKDAVTSSGLSKEISYVHFINSTQAVVAMEQGAEKPPAGKDKTPWGANKMIAIGDPSPNLSAIFAEAQASGSVKWLRWELINGRQAAVYSFAVPGNGSRLAVNVCCFPNVKQEGVAMFYSATTAGALGGGGQGIGGGGGGGVAGNFQTSTDWHAYKSTAPYHGEFFIDPDTGIVVRMITEAELKPTEVVHRLDTRIDYSPVAVDGKPLVLPVKSYINSEVVPNGDSGAGGYSTRKTLFNVAYKDYQPAFATH
jgi:hypothetical protein